MSEGFEYSAIVEASYVGHVVLAMTLLPKLLAPVCAILDPSSAIMQGYVGQGHSRLCCVSISIAIVGAVLMLDLCWIKVGPGLRGARLWPRRLMFEQNWPCWVHVGPM